VRRYGVITAINDNSRLQMFAGQSMDDSVRSYSYEVTLDDTEEKVTKYKASELQRDRKVYSKLIFKQYLRHTTTREPWINAPWMVKEHLAKRYGIPTKIPDDKTREAMLAQKRAANGKLTNGTSPPAQQAYPQHATNGHPPHVNGHRPQLPAPGQGQATFVNFSANGQQQYQQHQQHLYLPHMHGPPQHLPGFPPPQLIYTNGPPPGPPMTYPPYLLAHANVGPPPHLRYNLPNPIPTMHPHFQTSFVHNPPAARANLPQPQQAPQLARPFEPVKYPMEDLEIKQPRTEPVRPSLKFFSDDVPEGIEAPAGDKKTGILMKSLGPLLCAWETLNVHDTVYMLDSFTFDDFVGAMRFASEEEECELFVEVHCSILKQIISNSGKLQSPLPRMAEAEEEEEDENSSKESTPTPEPEPPKRTTRASLRKSGAQEIVRPRTPTPEPPKEIHNAEKFAAEFNWIEQCKIRNFREGGWQAIVVALLYRLSFDPIQKDACDEILAQLVPPEEEPTIESIANNYVHLDVNLRISALELILRLTVATEAFRDQLIAAAQEMTRLRKEKIEFQRKRKEL
jgi:alpha-1,3-glucosyltransferase